MSRGNRHLRPFAGRTLALAGCILGLLAQRSTAGNIIVGLASHTGIRCLCQDGLAQSFVAEDALVSLSVTLGDLNPHLGSKAGTLSLYEGFGIAGPLLGSLPFQLPADEALFRFDLSSMPLVVGSTYTFELTTLGGRGGAIHTDGDDLYGNGTMLIGGVVATGELVFRVEPLNELRNGGFEDGSNAFWASFNFWVATIGEARTGSLSVVTMSDEEISQRILPLPGKDIQAISLWLKQSSPAPVRVRLGYASGTSSAQDVSVVSGQWEFFDFTSLLDPTQDLELIGVSGNPAVATFLDDVIVAPEPSRLAAVLTALLAGLLAWARR